MSQSFGLMASNDLSPQRSCKSGWRGLSFQITTPRGAGYDEELKVFCLSVFFSTRWWKHPSFVFFHSTKQRGDTALHKSGTHSLLRTGTAACTAGVLAEWKAQGQAAARVSPARPPCLPAPWRSTSSTACGRRVAARVYSTASVLSCT